MRLRPFAPLVVLASALPGCGGPAAPVSGPGPAHGGVVLAIPGGGGRVEIAVEPEKSASATNQSRVVAYFNASDGVSPMSPPPTDVRVKLVTSPSPISLSSASADPSKFASEPGAYPDEARGELSATVSGSPVQIPFFLR